MRSALVLLFLFALQLGAQMPTEPESSQPGQEPEPEYNGPAVASRRGAASVTRDGELLRLRPYVAIHGLYDSGLSGVTLDSAGKTVSDAGFGVEGEAGVFGYHSWKRTTLGLDYHLNARHYDKATYYDGIDNALTLSLDHDINRRWRVQLGESLASYSQNYFVPYSVGIGISDYAPSGLSNLAANEAFDGRATALSGTARAIYQPTSRLSFSFGGTGFMVRRRSDALVGVDGYSASGDTAYRISRYQTIGVDYNFQHFGFQSAFGSTDAHGVGINYAARLTRRWEMKLRLGGSRVETVRLQTVAIDPVIAQLIGTAYGVETYHRTSYIPNFEGGLVRSFRQSALGMNYSRGLSPGNGLVLSSVYQGFSAYYSWTASRRLGLGLSAQTIRFSSLGETVGRYQSYGGGGGLTYLIARGFSLVARVDARHYELEQTTFNRTSYRASLGLAWSPGDVPLALW